MAPAQAALIIILGTGVLLISGCKRTPSSPTIAYEREIANQPPPAPKAVWMSDSYPWESSRKSDINTLPERLETMQSRFTAEMKIIDQTVHGKK